MSYGFMMLVLVAFLGINLYTAYKQQKKQQAEMMAFQDSLKPGDEVILTSGIFATIESIDDYNAMIRISDNCVVKIDRMAIVRLADQNDEPVVEDEPVEDVVEEVKEEPKNDE